MSIPPAPMERTVRGVRARSETPAGPQPSWLDQAMIEALESHIAHEEAALRTYGELATDSADAHVRYIAQMILEDETRHHRLLTDMLDRVRSDAAWTTEPNIPWLRTPRDRRALLDTCRGLLREERRDLAATRALKRRLRPQRDTSLLWIMVEILELDTRKHIRILEFLRRSARLR